MTWKDEAKNEFSGQFIKFDPGQTRVMRIEGEPTKRWFQPKDSDSKKVSFDFPVTEFTTENKDKLIAISKGVLGTETATATSRVWSVTSKRLIDLLIAEDDEAPIVNKTWAVKAIGDGMQRQWQVREVPEGSQSRVSDPWDARGSPSGMDAHLMEHYLDSEKVDKETEKAKKFKRAVEEKSKKITADTKGSDVPCAT